MEEATEMKMSAMFEEVAAYNPVVITITITIEIVVPIGTIV